MIRVFLPLMLIVASINFWGCISVKHQTRSMSPAVEKKPQDPLSSRLTIPHESYQLPNGLKVILSEDHKTPFVATSIWYGVGSIDEDKNKTGLAHLFEHLMFEGTMHTKAGDHFKLLEGASGINASTSFDRTNYYQTVPRSQLELALALESSRMGFLQITKEKLEEQREVVLREEEQRFRTAPYGMAVRGLWQKLFPEPDPLHELVIGSRRDIQNATLSDVQDFYDRFYGPSNATLTLVGDFDPNEAKRLIDKYFLTLPKSRELALHRFEHQPLKGQEIIRFPEKLGNLPLLRMQYLTPALFKPADAELDAVALILAGGEHGRLVRALTRDKDVASSVNVAQQSMSGVSVFTIDAVLNPGVNEQEAIKAIDDVLAGLVVNPPTPIEIDRARNFMLTNYFIGLQNIGGPSGRAETLQSYNHYAKDADFIQKDLARYQALDQNQIVKAVKDYLPSDAGRKILIAIPNLDEEMPKDKES